MKVYVVETGVYENRGIAGIYDSLAAAMAAFPRYTWRDEGEYGWAGSEDAASIFEYEVRGAGEG